MLVIYYLSHVLGCKHYLIGICLITGEKVETFPVIEIDQKDIVDTNGAGDAFVGGMVPKAFKEAKQKCVLFLYFIIVASFPPCSLVPIYYGLLASGLARKLGYYLTQDNS